MPKVFSAGLLACLLAAPALGAVIGEPKEPHQDQPQDTLRTHVEVISSDRYEYTVEFGGTIDGTMTRMPIGYAAFVQGWQPNRWVVIENMGSTDVKNPRLVVDDQRDWRSLPAVVAEATRGYTHPADKARAVWEFVRRQRFHACTWDAECSDALKALNVYGYTLCGNQARVLSDLWKAAGLKTRRCYPTGHVVSEVFYNGRFHMLDSDEHVVCLLRDNQTIASAEEMVRDHDLIKRTHSYSIGRVEDRKTDERSASLYGYEGKRKGDFGNNTHHSMDLTLRPGEAIEFRWDHVGKQYTKGAVLKKGQRRRDGLGHLLSGWGPTAYDKLRNGKLRYRPDLSSRLVRRGTEAVENISFDTGAGQIKPTSADQPAQITWRFAGPYVFVGGQATATLELGPNSSAEWRYSTDQKTWDRIASTSDTGQQKFAACLDQVVSPRGRPTYRFWLQLSLRGEGAVTDVTFDNDIQTSALSLPELTTGANHVAYADSSTEGRQVRVTHRWLERNTWHRPDAPAEAVVPQDGATVEGTRVRLAWSTPSDPDGDAIVDYHFELSAHPDMRWPLSPNFEKQTSLTPSKGKPEWTVPDVGLLNPDTTYYWHVRALDATGVWGPWSRTFRFRARAPGVPLELKLTPDADGGLTLSWKANTRGRPAVAYKVYGSDEKGFSVSDDQYPVYRGKGFVTTMEEFASKPADAPDAGLVQTPANLMAKVRQTHLRVVGAELELPNCNRAYYRVAALDSAGNQSGASDYVAVPRPLVYTRPQTPAKVGVPYQYQPKVIRSIGDLRCHRSETSSYNAAYWDREQFTFQAIRLPEGLALEPETGLISGTPKRSGTLEIVFRVSASSGTSATVTQELLVTE